MEYSKDDFPKKIKLTKDAFGLKKGTIMYRSAWSGTSFIKRGKSFYKESNGGATYLLSLDEVKEF